MRPMGGPNGPVSWQEVRNLISEIVFHYLCVYVLVMIWFGCLTGTHIWDCLTLSLKLQGLMDCEFHS